MTFKCYDCDTAIIDSDAVFKTIAGFSAPLCKTCHAIRYPEKNKVEKEECSCNVTQWILSGNGIQIDTNGTFTRVISDNTFTAIDSLTS